MIMESRDELAPSPRSPRSLLGQCRHNNTTPPWRRWALRQQESLSHIVIGHARLNVRHWIDCLDDLGWRTHCDREIGDVLGDDAAGPNGATPADCHARHDGGVAANPAVALDGDGFGVFDAIPPRLNTCLMRRGED